MTNLKKVSPGAGGALSKRRPRTLRVFAPATEADWRHAGLLIAELKDWDARQSQVGCAAFRRLTSDVCELYDVYVRPSCRRRGIGSALLRRLMHEAMVYGYRTMCLETATFMRDAHRLYELLHFQVRAPYRSIPARYAQATKWMECKLDA